MNRELSKAPPLHQATTVREMLKNPRATDQIRAVAASAVNPMQMVRQVPLIFRKTPLLAECTPMSFLGGMMTAASLGLVPNTATGECYLIPFKNGKLSKAADRDVYEIELVIGYRGLIKLARRSGGLNSIHADVATKDEWEEHDDKGRLFDWEQGSGAFLRHKAMYPDGEPMFVYAYAELSDGTAQLVWPWERVLAHRDKFSKGYQQALREAKKGKKWVLEQTPWVLHQHAMARKTLIRQIVPMLDLTIEGATALEVDENRRLAMSQFAMQQPSDLRPGDIPEQLPEDPGDDGSDDEASADGVEDAEVIESDGEGKVQTQAKPAERAKSAKKPTAQKDAKSESKPKESKPKADEQKKSGGDLFGGDQDETKVEGISGPMASEAETIITAINESTDSAGLDAVMQLNEQMLAQIAQTNEDAYNAINEAAEVKEGSFG